MGEKGMESTAPVGPGSAATAVGGRNVEQLKPSGGVSSMGDALAGQGQMSDHELGGGEGMSDKMQQASSSGDESMKKDP